MCKAFRQRSIWAMIKLFSLMYDYYFFLLRGGISLLLYSPYSLTIIKERYRWKTQIHFKVCVILITKNRYIFVINLSVSTCFLRSALNQTTKLNLTAILTSRLNKLVASKQTFLNHKHSHLSVVKLLKSCVENMFSFQLLVNALR